MSALTKTKTAVPHVPGMFARLMAWVLAPFRKPVDDGTIPAEAMQRLLHEVENPSPMPEHCVQSLRELMKDSSR